MSRFFLRKVMVVGVWRMNGGSSSFESGKPLENFL